MSGPCDFYDIKTVVFDKECVRFACSRDERVSAREQKQNKRVFPYSIIHIPLFHEPSAQSVFLSRISGLQKITLLGTAHILRKVLSIK